MTMSIESLFSTPPGPKALAFVTELQALCEKHDVCLCTSGYDGLEVRDLYKPDGALYANGIEDKTAAGAVAAAEAEAIRSAIGRAARIAGYESAIVKLKAKEFSESTANVTGRDTWACPDCGASKEDGHRWECELKAKIKGMEDSLAKERQS